jgi:hypothetical protein
MFDLKYVLTVLYNFGIQRIPGIGLLIPFDALMAIAEAVESGVEHDLKVDLKITKPGEILHAFAALYTVAVNREGPEAVGKVYDLLKIVTNIEDHKTREDFISESTGAIALLPASTVEPTEPVDEDAVYKSAELVKPPKEVTA